MKAFHKANFGATRTHLYVVGRFDPATVRAAVEKAFQSWMPGAPPTQVAAPPAPPAKVVLIDRPGAPQSTVWIGKRVDQQGYDVDFRAASTLLGATFPHASRATSVRTRGTPIRLERR
ncbi:insulinase family protein [Novosphingobium panipatense]|uniref:insulinase family protein n=1 Tax=Novosphingobium panipatense TaxID=428991 RepID=UPI00360950E8